MERFDRQIRSDSWAFYLNGLEDEVFMLLLEFGVCQFVGRGRPDKALFVPLDHERARITRQRSFQAKVFLVAKSGDFPPGMQVKNVVSIRYCTNDLSFLFNFKQLLFFKLSFLFNKPHYSVLDRLLLQQHSLSSRHAFRVRVFVLNYY